MESVLSVATLAELRTLKEHGAPTTAILKEVARALGEPEAFPRWAARMSASLNAGPLSEGEVKEMDELTRLELRRELDPKGQERLIVLLNRRLASREPKAAARG